MGRTIADLMKRFVGHKTEPYYPRDTALPSYGTLWCQGIFLGTLVSVKCPIRAS